MADLFRITFLCSIGAAICLGVSPPDYVSVEDFLSLSKNQAWKIVDARPSESFRAFHIPGSINVPPALLPALEAWKKTPILLVGEGYRHVELERTSAKLRERGFTSVRILDGGLAFWKAWGGKLDGDAGKSLRRVPPSAFRAESESGNWLIVDISPEDCTDVAHVFSTAVRLPWSGNAAALRAPLARLVSGNPSVSVLLVDSSARRTDSLLGELTASRLPVFLLDGGATAYAADLSEVGRIAAHRSVTQGPPSSCGGAK